MPNSLVIDYSTDWLYWADARLDKIERAELDGSHRKVSPTKFTHDRRPTKN